jgi:hypothetical protein
MAPCPVPTMEGKTAFGASSPAKPALHIPDPLSTTRAIVSSSHILLMIFCRLSACGKGQLYRAVLAAPTYTYRQRQEGAGSYHAAVAWPPVRNITIYGNTERKPAPTGTLDKDSTAF